METIEQKKELEAKIKLRLAKPADFKKQIWIDTPEGSIQKTVPKIGQPYWLKSKVTNTFDNWPYFVKEDTNWEEIRSWLQNEMIYVPQIFLDE